MNPAKTLLEAHDDWEDEESTIPERTLTDAELLEIGAEEHELVRQRDMERFREIYAENARREANLIPHKETREEAAERVRFELEMAKQEIERLNDRLSELEPFVEECAQGPGYGGQVDYANGVLSRAKGLV